MLWLVGGLACRFTAQDQLLSLPTASPPAPLLQVTSTPLPRVSATAVMPDTGWHLLRPGLERRQLSGVQSNGQVMDTLIILRLEPDLFQFNVAYAPGEPRMLSQWLLDSNALIVVNGGYFTESFLATGLIIADGEASGSSYGPFAGMFTVTAAGPDLRWLAEQPYDPAEPILAGLQSFPLLVKPGGQLGFPIEDGVVARRTVIARDADGRILFIIATRSSFTLHRLSAYLVNSDLDLDIALNLDGGTSTGLILADPLEEIPAFTPLPAVITVHPK